MCVWCDPRDDSGCERDKHAGCSWDADCARAELAYRCLVKGADGKAVKVSLDETDVYCWCIHGQYNTRRETQVERMVKLQLRVTIYASCFRREREKTVQCSLLGMWSVVCVRHLLCSLNSDWLQTHSMWAVCVSLHWTQTLSASLSSLSLSSLSLPLSLFLSFSLAQSLTCLRAAWHSSTSRPGIFAASLTQKEERGEKDWLTGVQWQRGNRAKEREGERERERESKWHEKRKERRIIRLNQLGSRVRSARQGLNCNIWKRKRREKEKEKERKRREREKEKKS